MVYKYHGFSVHIKKYARGKGYAWKITAPMFGSTYTYRQGQALVENEQQVKAIAREQIRGML